MNEKMLDLKGEVCPYTFVKTKLQLEEMKKGGILKIKVDHPPAVNNIVKSLEIYGEEILGIDHCGESCWEIKVKKKSNL